MGNNVKLLTLEEWASRTYADNIPAVKTLRRWANSGNIYPAPEKHGRSYRVKENAIYIKPHSFTLARKLYAEAQQENANPLLAKIMSEIPIPARKKRT
ncbi:excisionase [Serratia quinivorans]|uniref:excisionase n=1 Tax=Serratia quinivorans TaxID=137545 RepID=UPI002178D571|nr:Excisionase-like protein [Serratia quinivorans]CAI2150560.1 Excisionase-like protein [Serratia quinivorans]